MIAFYNSQLGKSNDKLNYDPTKISWSSNLIAAAGKKEKITIQDSAFTKGVYRPFNRQHLYCGEKVVNRRGQFDDFFPTPAHKNRVICISGVGVTNPFSCLMTDVVPDLEFIGKSQCFPLYVYTKDEEREQMTLFDKGNGGYRRESGITDFMLNRCRKEFGEKVTKEDIFYYIYAVLHSPNYRSRFDADLKKSLARIPLCKTGAEFAAFVKAGCKLGDLHCGYENAEMNTDCVVDVAKGVASPFALTKMRFAKKEHPVDENRNGKLERWELEDHTRIIYNEHVTIRGIPLPAYDYVVNGKSAIEWIMERYQFTKDKNSGIVNDPNLWLKESGNERYVVDLLRKVITVSIETQELVAKLPRLEL